MQYNINRKKIRLLKFPSYKESADYRASKGGQRKAADHHRGIIKYHFAMVRYYNMRSQTIV